MAARTAVARRSAVATVMTMRTRSEGGARMTRRSTARRIEMDHQVRNARRTKRRNPRKTRKTDPRRNTRNVRTGTVTTARPTRIPTRTRTARIRTRMAASIVKSPPGRIRYVPRPECVRNHFDVDSLKPASVCVCVCV
uniref:(northern house mosquito) hypothetical protein n=1 Tax=Culex pipiens TaxID=7175 RepID=A0A8D8KZ76_CULPI